MAQILPFLRQPHRYPSLRMPVWPFAMNQDHSLSVGMKFFLGAWHGSFAPNLAVAHPELSVVGTAIGALLPESDDVFGNVTRRISSASYGLAGDPVITAYPVTIAGWGRTNSSQTYQTICDYGSSVANNINMSVQLVGATANRGGGFVRNSSTTTLTGITAPTADTKWHCLVQRCKASTVHELFVDGESERKTTTSVPFPTGDRFGTHALVDSTPSSLMDDTPPGYVGPCFLWDRAITEAEIFALWDPATRFDLWHELGRTFYSIPAAAAAGGIRNPMGGPTVLRNPLGMQ